MSTRVPGRHPADLPDPLAAWPETITWQPVSHRLVWLAQAHLLAWSAAALLVCAAAGAWLGVRPALAAAALVVLGTAARAVLIVRTVRAWGYAARDADLLVRHGLFVRRLSVVPYARMQYVDVTAGPLERLLGLATVQMHTAAAASNARVPGLSQVDAARLRDRLTTLGELQQEGL